MKKAFLLIIVLFAMTLTLSGCGHYWGHCNEHSHSHYNGCGHRGY